MCPGLGQTGKIRQPGFSLLEILVVLIIVSVLVGTVGLNYVRGDTEELDRTVQQLRDQLLNVRDTAILQGRPYSVIFSDNGYSILVLNRENRLVSVKDDTFTQPTDLPPGYKFSNVDIPESSSDDVKGLLFDPTGLLPEFRVSVNNGRHTVALTYAPEKGFQIAPVS